MDCWVFMEYIEEKVVSLWLGWVSILTFLGESQFIAADLT